MILTLGRSYAISKTKDYILLTVKLFERKEIRLGNNKWYETIAGMLAI